MAFETGSIIARFRSETKALLDGIKQVDRAVAQLKSRVETSLAGTFSNALRSDFNRATQTFRRQASSLSDIFRGSFAGIGMISESVKADIPKTEAAVRDQGLRAAQTFTTGLAAAKTALSDAVSTDTGRLRRIVTQQAQSLTEAFRGTVGGIRFSDTLSQDFARATQTFRRQASDLSRIFRQSFAGVGLGLVESIRSGAPGAINAVRSQAQNLSRVFSENVSGIRDAVSGFIRSDAGRVRNVVGDISRNVAQTFRSAFDQLNLSSVIRGDFTGAQRTFSRLASSLSQVFQRSFQGIGLGFSESIRNDIPRAVRAVRSQAQSLTQTFRSGIAGIGTAFSDLVRGDNRRLGTVVREQARNVGNVFRRAIGSVSFSDQIESDIPRSQRLFQNLFTGIANQARNVSQILGQAFQTGLANVSIAFSDSIRADIPRARGLLNGFFAGIRQQAQSASAAIGQVFSTAFEGGIPTAGLAAFRLGITTLTRTVGLLTQSFVTFGRVSRRVISSVVTALRVLQRVGRQTFNVLRGGARALLSPFNLLSRTLQRSIFSLKNLLLVIGSVALVRRAKDVETLTLAFENLSTSVGSVADSLLRRLRAATRGTVSDLELMRSTNQAVLLNIVQSEEQFAELANVARRLGRAVGRDAVQALNDLALGIGRQSRLILDNLGLIVRVEESNRAYAAALGKTVEQLTDTEKRQAFMNATMDAARRKVRELGPDVLTTADAWDRFATQISNTISILAREFIGGALPTAISDFLSENQRRIRVFARVAADSLSDLARSIRNAFRDLDFRDLLQFLSNALADIFTTLGAVIARIAPSIFFGLADIFVAGIRTAFSVAQAKLTKPAQDFVDFLKFTIVDTFGELVFPAADVERLKKDITDRVISRGAAQEAGTEAGRNLRRGLSKPLSDAINNAFTDVSDAIRETFGEKGLTIPEPRIDETRFGKSLTDFVQRVQERFDRIGLRFRNPLEDLQPLRVNRLLQPIEFLVNKLQELQLQLTRVRLPQFLLNPTVVNLTAAAIVSLREKLSSLSRTIFQVTRFFEGFKFPEQELTQKLQPFEQALEKLQLEAQTLDLDPVSRELFKFNQAFLNIEDRLSPEQAGRVARVRSELEKIINIRRAREAAQEFSKAIEELNRQIQTLAASQEGIELGEFVRQVTELTNRFGSQAQFAERLSEALNQLTELTIRNFSNEARRLGVELEALTQDLSDGEIQARELRNEWNRVRQTLEGRISSQSLLSIETALGRVESKIREIARQEIIIGFRSDIAQQLVQTRDQFDQVTGKATELDIQLRELGRAADEARDKLSQIKGTTEEDLQAITNQAQALEIELRKLAEARQIRAAQSQLEQAFTRPFSRAVFGGLAEGLRRGQSAMETFADIGAQLFQNSMNQAVEQISSFLSKSLTGVFGEAAGAFGGIASGVLGAAGLILSNLESRTSQTIEDFGDQVSSSEAIRGVVAGPTNVAISAVGSQLKDALRTSEQFLQRIALATESMAQGGGGGVGPATGNFVFPLTGSTT